MKSRAPRTTIALTILLGVFVFILSCGDQAPNNTKISAPANADKTASLANPCRPNLDIGPRIGELQTEVDAQIAGDGSLQLQKDQGAFSVKFERYPDVSTGQTIVMRVKGKLRGIQPPPDPQAPNVGDRDGTLKTLLRFIDKYIKKGCVHKVIFEPMSSVGTTSAVAFEWGACDDGKILCENGICQTACDGMIPKDPPASNANSNVNANAPVNPNPGNTGTNSTNANRSNSNTGRNIGP